MKLLRANIENFRSLKRCSINFHDLTAIVGENNSGKTAILRALNSFFNYEFEAHDFENGVHKYALKTITRITLYFSEIPDRPEYRELIGSNGEMAIRFSYNYSKSSSGRKWSSIINGIEKTLDFSFINILKSDIDYVYIPAVRGNDDIKWSEKSIFSRIVKKYLEDYTNKRDTLSSKAKDAGDRIKKQALNRLSSELTNLNICNDVGKYQIEFLQDIDYHIFLDKLGLTIFDDEEMRSRQVAEYGSGIKSLTVIALHRMLANLNHVSVILGIEEPETNLHPQAQRILINSLKNSRQTCESQTVFATHSTVIVDALNHSDIVLVRRVKDSNRGFHSEVSQISESFWDEHDIQDQKYSTFFKYRNSDFFFAKFVILVEGVADAQAYEHMLGGNLNKGLSYVSIVNMDGVANIIYPFFLLKDLGIPFCAVVDKDFFTPYKNGKLKDSRNPMTSFPEYSGEIANNKVIDYLFDTEEKKEILKNQLRGSYSRLFDYVKAYNIIPLQYCLEMDLISTSKGKEKYFDYYGLNGEKRTNKELLEVRKKAIKDPTVLIPILESLDYKDYPISYKKVRRYLMDCIDQCVN